MKYNNGLMISTVALALMATGCVKKADNLTATESTIYNTTPAPSQVTYETPITTYETATPIVYDESATVTNGSGTTYSEVVTDNTMITTGNGSYGGYQEATGVITSANTYNTAPVTPANNNYGSGAYSTASNVNTTYNNPYAGQVETNNNYSTNNSYSNDYSTPAPSSSTQSGGIHLQIAALKNYYAAEEFKNSLSLDAKYSAYIKRGVMNKVIISGISSVSEANRLKERRFPGAFIVRNGGNSSSASSSHGSSAYGSGYSNSSNNSSAYTVNNDYGYSASSSSSTSGVGIQIGAFSSRSKAQGVANAQSGQYQAIVKKGTSRGRTIYRVVLTGFSSRSAAKRALSSGQIRNGFVTTSY